MSMRTRKAKGGLSRDGMTEKNRGTRSWEIGGTNEAKAADCRRRQWDDALQLLWATPLTALSPVN